MCKAKLKLLSSKLQLYGLYKVYFLTESAREMLSFSSSYNTTFLSLIHSHKQKVILLYTSLPSNQNLGYAQAHIIWHSGSNIEMVGVNVRQS